MLKLAVLLVIALSLQHFATAGSLTANSIKTLKNRMNTPSLEDNDVQNKMGYNLSPIKEQNGNQLFTSNENEKKDEESQSKEHPQEPIPCTCGVFLSGQFKKASKEQPKGVPVITQEMDSPFMNNPVGVRQCTNKCLELIIKHLPKSSDIICATVDREEVNKEKAYLFVKNHVDKWLPTNLSAGREFCCKDNLPFKCHAR